MKSFSRIAERTTILKLGGEIELNPVACVKLLGAAALLTSARQVVKVAAETPFSLRGECVNQMMVAAETSKSLAEESNMHGVASDLQASLGPQASCLLKGSREKHLSAMQAELQTAYEDLKRNIYDEQGELWSASLAPGAAFLEVYKRAEATVLQRKGPELQRAINHVKHLAEKYLDIHAVHGAPLVKTDWPDWFVALANGVLDAASVVSSGILLKALKTKHGNPQALKGIAKGQIKQSQAPLLGGSFADRYHPAVIAAAKLASNTHFVWPGTA